MRARADGLPPGCDVEHSAFPGERSIHENSEYVSADLRTGCTAADPTRRSHTIAINPKRGKEKDVAATRADLIDALAGHIATPPLTPAEIEAVLSLAAVAAHGTGDRTAAPLASFLAGIAAAGSDDRAATLDEIRGRAAELAPAPEG